MKHGIAAWILVLACDLASSQDALYRCGNEYTNAMPKGREHLCRLIDGGTVKIVETPDGPIAEWQPTRPSVNWVEIASTQGVVVFVERSSVKPQARYIKAWLLWSYETPDKLYSGKEYKSVKALTYFDCKAGTAGIKSENFFTDAFGDGDSVGSRQIEDNKVVFVESPPQSVGVAMVERVCAKKISR